MKITSPTTKNNFKGYDALPLKNIYLEESYCEPFIDEMKAIAQQEGFEIKTAYDNDQWIQDDKTIIEKASKPFLIANGEVSDNFIGELKRQGIDGKRTSGFLAGGDTFIGKYPNGDKWIITGEAIPFKTLRKEVSDTYGVSEKHIYSLPKQNYHLDTFIRPVGYPFVLVNDFQLVDKNIQMLDDNSPEFDEYKKQYEKFKKNLSEKYMGINTVCNALQARGFIPVKIAGVYGPEINFMNAIINKHSDGTISYITNSSDTGNNDFYKKIQDRFEKDLREKVSNLSETYFVKGNEAQYQGKRFYGIGIENQRPNPKLNNMMATLKYQGGGIHCMSLEEPDFEAWT